MTARFDTIVLAVAVVGCSNAGPPGGCDPCRTTAIANVYVRDGADQPVAGVTIHIRSYLATCGTALRGGEGGQVTLADGHRRILMSSLYSPHTARCFVVLLNPESDPTQPTDSAQFTFTADVEFRAEDGSPRDSVRFDMVVSRNAPSRRRTP